jgi:uncharacterized protein (DUF697 family)
MAAAATAATLGATPIPFADAALLVPMQVGMLAKISSVFGLGVSTGLLTTLAASVAGAAGATMAGRAIVSNLLKLVPGAGSLVGGAISAATAGAVTTTLGEIYIATLAKLFADSGCEAPRPEDVVREFKKRL